MKNRIMVTLPPLDVFFLPHVSDFLRIALGDSGSFPRLLETMAGAAGVKAPHRQTLKKAESEPVTRGAAIKIQHVWHSSLPDEQFLKELEVAAEPWNALQLKNNGTSWMAALAGVERTKIGAAVKESRVARFVQKRTALEKFFLDWIKQQTDRQPNRPRQDAVWIRQAQEFLTDNTLVDPELISLMAGINLAANDPKSEEWRWGKGILRLVNHQLRIDFYYTLLCELALDVADYLEQHGVYGAHRKQLVEWGFVGDIAPGFLSQRHEKDSPLVRLFEVWRHRLSELNSEELSVRKMARFLPLPGDCTEEEFSNSCETPADHKYRRLKKWRNGEIPDPSDLETFIARLCEGHESDHYLAWMKAQVALAWGRLINEEEDALAELFIEQPDFQRFNALGSYSRYWNRYQNQAAEISAT
jgi:hypothetical protein